MSRSRKIFEALVTIAVFGGIASLTMAAFAIQEPSAISVMDTPVRVSSSLSDAAWASIATMVGSIVAAITAAIVALRTNRLPLDLSTGEAQTKLALEIARLNKIIDDYQEVEDKKNDASTKVV